LKLTDTPSGAKTSGFRAFTVHEEKRRTGNFRIRRVNGSLQTQCEVEIVKTRTLEHRSNYTTFRPARPEELDEARVRAHRIATYKDEIT
jgi:hypothetical protein